MGRFTNIEKCRRQWFNLLDPSISRRQSCDEGAEPTTLGDGLGAISITNIEKCARQWFNLSARPIYFEPKELRRSWLLKTTRVLGRASLSRGQDQIHLLVPRTRTVIACMSPLRVHHSQSSAHSSSLGSRQRLRLRLGREPEGEEPPVTKATAET